MWREDEKVLLDVPATHSGAFAVWWTVPKVLPSIEPLRKGHCERHTGLNHGKMNEGTLQDRGLGSSPLVMYCS